MILFPKIKIVFLTSLAKKRNNAINYSIFYLGEETTFIDFGNFLQDIKDLFDGKEDLKSSIDKLLESMENLIIAKSLGRDREGSFGLSIYYPINGESRNIYTEQNFIKQDLFEGNSWANYLKLVKEEYQNVDFQPEFEIEDQNQKLQVNKDNPIDINFTITNANDAVKAYLDLTINRQTEHSDGKIYNEYVHLSEINKIEINDNGTYTFNWDSKIHRMYLKNKDDGIDLGGFFDENNFYVCYIDYQPPGSESFKPLIFYLTFDESGKGKVDKILDNTQNNLSPTRYTQKFEKGGILYPNFFIIKSEISENKISEYYYLIDWNDFYYFYVKVKLLEPTLNDDNDGYLEWVGLYKKDDVPGTDSAINWGYINKNFEVDWKDFSDSWYDSNENYILRLFKNDTYIEIANSGILDIDVDWLYFKEEEQQKDFYIKYLDYNLIIPEKGLDGIEFKFDVVPNDNYLLDINLYDSYNYKSETLSYKVEVNNDEKIYTKGWNNISVEQKINLSEYKKKYNIESCYKLKDGEYIKLEEEDNLFPFYGYLVKINNKR